jgi:hypothetical protein
LSASSALAVSTALSISTSSTNGWRSSCARGQQHRGAGARVRDARVRAHEQHAVGRLLGEQPVLLVAPPQRVDDRPQLLSDARLVAQAVLI